MKHLLSIFALAATTLILFFTNYQTGTFLTGWDNLHPEFNFSINIKRSIFAVWQEYQGIGLLGGMGHASDLPHQTLLALLSIVFPVSLLRYVFTFLMLFIGSVGVYFLIRSISLINGELNAKRYSLYALLGSLFYLLNLATVQAFYTPFETFTAHYFALPWVILGSIKYYQSPTRKHFIWFCLILLLTMTQGYVPTLFLVSIIAVAIILFAILIKNSFKNNIDRISKIFLAIIFVNAFWLFPFLYFTFTNVGVNLNAKINQMATETIFLQNKEFGNLSDVMLLKGFWFNNVDPNLSGVFSYMMPSWRAHIANPSIAAIGYFFFAVILVGVFSAVTSKKPLLTGFVMLFVFSFTMLATNTPPFSWFDILFRKIPLFEQVFRFPFTKFSILAALTYSIFFTMGIKSVVDLFESRIKSIIHYSRLADALAKRALFIIPVLLLVIFTLPAFQGHLFYDKERLAIPKEYFQLFDFFKKQDPNTRIANFPQHTFWGWNFYNWPASTASGQGGGYGGSGFLWYGIKQPILDRAFDVWSKTSENYYFEVSYALYSKNPKLFTSVLNKYQIQWILIDKNVINPSSPKALFFPETKELIAKISDIKREAVFGNIEIYKVNLKDNPNNFIFLATKLPTVNSYKWGESDQAYTDKGNYITTTNSQLPDVFYPFRSLFSNKQQNDIEFSFHESYDNITFSSILPPVKNNGEVILIPEYLEKEDIVPADIIVKNNSKNNTLSLSLNIHTPEIFLDNKTIWGGTTQKELAVVSGKISYPLHLNVNGIADYTLKNEDGFVQQTFISAKADNVFVLKDNTDKVIQTFVISSYLRSINIGKTLILPLVKNDKKQSLVIKIAKISDGYAGMEIKPSQLSPVKNCDNFRKGNFSSALNNQMLQLQSSNSTACTAVNLPTLFHKQGYAVSIINENIQGRPPHFWILNDTGEDAIIDTYLSASKTVNTYILSPQDPFGKGYSLHVDNISIGTDQTINNLGRIYVYPIPYNFLTSIALTDDKSPVQTFGENSLKTSHPNESLYIVEKSSGEKNDVLVLSQSFNPGWKAYNVKIKDQKSLPADAMHQALQAGKIKNFFISYFPFFFGDELKEHVLVNNWANGWKLDKDTCYMSPVTCRLVILFLPQYLEYFGFGLGIITIAYLLLRYKNASKVDKKEYSLVEYVT